MKEIEIVPFKKPVTVDGLARLNRRGESPYAEEHARRILITGVLQDITPPDLRELGLGIIYSAQEEGSQVRLERTQVSKCFVLLPKELDKIIDFQK